MMESTNYVFIKNPLLLRWTVRCNARFSSIYLNHFIKIIKIYDQKKKPKNNTVREREWEREREKKRERRGNVREIWEESAKSHETQKKWKDERPTLSEQVSGMSRWPHIIIAVAENTESAQDSPPRGTHLRLSRRKKAINIFWPERWLSSARTFLQDKVTQPTTTSIWIRRL